MVANAVSRLVADLKYPLSGVSELVFQRLEEGLIVGKICEDICEKGTFKETALAKFVSPEPQQLEELISFAIIHAISSRKNLQHIVKLLHHFNYDTDSPIEQLLDLHPLPSSLEVQPLRISHESSRSTPPVFQPNDSSFMSFTGGLKTQAPSTPRSTATDQSLQNQPTLNHTFSPVSGIPPQVLPVKFSPNAHPIRRERTPHPAKTGTLATTSIQNLSNPQSSSPPSPNSANTLAKTGYRTPTPHLGDKSLATISSVSPLIQKVSRAGKRRYHTLGTSTSIASTPSANTRAKAGTYCKAITRAQAGRNGNRLAYDSYPHGQMSSSSPFSPPSAHTRGQKYSWKQSGLSGTTLSKPPKRYHKPSSSSRLKSSPRKHLLTQPPRRRACDKVSRLAKPFPLLPKRSPPRRAAKRKVCEEGPQLDSNLTVEARIRISYAQWARYIALQTGRSMEGPFNMNRVGPNHKNAILTPQAIQKLLQRAEKIIGDIWLSSTFDDRELRSSLGDDSKDLLDLSNIGSKVMDISFKIREKINKNNDDKTLLEFLNYFVLRFEDMTTTKRDATLRREMGRYEQDVGRVYECLLEIFSKLGPSMHGRQLSLLNSLLKQGIKNLCGYIPATLQPIACDILLHKLNVVAFPPLKDPNQATLLDCIEYLLKPANGKHAVTQVLRGELVPKCVDPEISKARLQEYSEIDHNEPPTKKQKGNPDSGYSSGPSETYTTSPETTDEFSHNVELLAEELNRSGPIVATATNNRLFESSCDANSIRKLKPSSPIDDHLIDVVPGLFHGPEKSVYLGTKFYGELKKKGYGNTTKWTKRLEQRGRWFFPICTYLGEDEDEGRDDRRVDAINLNWDAGWVEYYNLRYSSFSAMERREEVAREILPWVRNISKRDLPLKLVNGLQQEKDNMRYYGDYILAFLCLCAVGREIHPGVDMDVMAHRRHFLEVLSKAIKDRDEALVLC